MFNLTTIKIAYQLQLQPLNIGNKIENKDNKRKDNSTPTSERNLDREQKKSDFFQIQKKDEYQIDQNNVSDKNQINTQNQENLYFNQNGQKRYYKNQNYKISSNSEFSPKNTQLNHKFQSQNSRDMVSPKSIVSNPANNHKISFQKNEKQFGDIKQNQNEESQQLIQNNINPQIHMNIQNIDSNRQLKQQNIKIKSSQNLNSANLKKNSEFQNEIEKNKFSNKKVKIQFMNHQKSDLNKNQNVYKFEDQSVENQISQISQQNPLAKNQNIGDEKILQKVTSEQKIPSKVDIQQRPVRNQNFRINIPKTIGSRSNEDNQVISATNGSNNSQSKETSDTPQSQADDKSQESLTDIYNNNQYKNQINISLQDLEQVKIDNLPSFQMHESNKSTKSAASENLIDKRRQESSLILLSEPGSAKNSHTVQQIAQKYNENNDYLDAQIGELLGQGAYGKVFKGFIKTRGKFIAIKEIKEEQMQTDNSLSIVESIYKEIQLLKKLSHKNIVNYIGSKKSDGCVYIYMEYMSGGSISEMLKRYGGFDEKVIQKFVKQLLEGLTYLHSKGVIHRDLKGANILSDGCGNVKLADFGAARSIENILLHSLTQSEYCNSIQGSLYWMAPELIKNEKHGRRIDVWSLGCTVIEMASGMHPWQNIKKYSELANVIFEQQSIPIPEHLSQECKDFIQQCCTYDKKLRSKSNQLLSHPFLSKTYN